MSEMAEVTVVLKGPNPEKRFLVEIATGVRVQELKPDILEALGKQLGYALDISRYDLTWQGSYDEPVLIFEKIN